MSYVSKIYSGEPIIENKRDAAVSIPYGLSAGLNERDLSQFPMYGFAKAVDIPIIPRSEWSERIKEIEETHSRLSDLSYSEGILCKNQEATNYCWANSIVYCVELVRMSMGLGVKYLSPASVAAPIKNYKNSPGFASEALKYIIDNGIVPEENWPANSRDKGLMYPENEKRAKQYKVTEWYDISSKSFDELMTCLILRIPAAVGYMWWRHQVCAVDPICLGENVYGIRIRNSWGMDYGKDGYAIIKENLAAPDDSVAPRVAKSYRK